MSACQDVCMSACISGVYWAIISPGSITTNKKQRKFYTVCPSIPTKYTLQLIAPVTSREVFLALGVKEIRTECTAIPSDSIVPDTAQHHDFVRLLRTEKIGPQQIQMSELENKGTKVWA